MNLLNQYLNAPAAGPVPTGVPDEPTSPEWFSVAMAIKQVTISGSGFGSAKGTGTVWLGSTSGRIVSWSDTQVVATVASNSTSGTARVQQGGAWSNAVPLNVTTATISSVAPPSGVPGTQVTITGSGFGAAQGSGQVWLGTANGAVQSWSDTQVVAAVAAGSASGNAQLLQNGVLSNPVQFDVNTLHLSGVSPASGAPGTAVTFTGTGFGSSQGAVLLGSTGGQVSSWSDTQVVATVAPGALTGIARIQKDGAWSNAVAFTVTVPGGNAVTLEPNLLNMVVGDTHKMQALSPAGQPVLGLTWASSDPNVVGLPSDDPPVLSARAVGHVTITAGTASADVTVSAGPLPVGTVLWSNPGNGSGVYSIVPAVPSPSGVADVFAFQDDGTVQAITSDGTTAWTADVSQAAPWGTVVPDFQGGLVFIEYQNDERTRTSFVKLDGMTGQRYPAYTPVQPSYIGPPLGVHPDGTIFAVQYYRTSDGDNAGESLIAIDPATGTQKFSVSIPGGVYGDLIIAGDGYAYVPCGSQERPALDVVSNHLGLLRVSSAGTYDYIQILDWTARIPAYFDLLPPFGVTMITNADQGVLLTWALTWEQDTYGMAITTGASASLISAPQIPGGGPLVPVLQLQDGSFVGTVQVAGGFEEGYTFYMVAFDATGNLRWSLPNYDPQIATADGGLIATIDDGSRSAVTFDQNGNVTGQIANLPTYSWQGNWYRYGSTDQVDGMWYYLGGSFWALWTGQYTFGTGGIPIDSKANEKANAILSPAMWQEFKKSNCAKVFKEGFPLMGQTYDESLRGVQEKQHRTNFYDVGNPTIGDLMVRLVTGENYWHDSDQTLRDYLLNAKDVAATANMGESKRTAIVLSAGFFSRPRPEFILVHEVLFHAYYGLSDGAPYGNSVFLKNGLWGLSPNGFTLSPWMSTDCTCTPGKPGSTCQENTARW